MIYRYQPLKHYYGTYRSQNTLEDCEKINLQMHLLTIFTILYHLYAVQPSPEPCSASTPPVPEQGSPRLWGSEARSQLCPAREQEKETTTTPEHGSH